MKNPIDSTQHHLARWRLERTAGVTLARDARVNARSITLRPGCTLHVGARSVIEATIDLERDGAVILIGENSYVGASIIKCARRIEIGNHVEIAWNCSIVDHDWEPLAWEQREVDMRDWYSAEKNWTHVRVAPVRIGDRALVGFNSVILKGVHIGEGAVVGVGSVVTKDVPPFTVVAGVPARVVRRLDAAEPRPPSS